MTGWRVVDPIQRVGGSRLIATYAVTRVSGFATQFGFPVYPNLLNWPRPFPRYSQAAFQAAVPSTSGTQQSLINVIQANMNFWWTRNGGVRPPGARFVSGIGPNPAGSEPAVSVYGVSDLIRQVTFNGSPADWVNHVPAAERQPVVNAHTGLSGNLVFAPFPVFINNAFRLISVEPG